MPERRRTRTLGACLTALTGLLASACLVNDGLEPPRGVLNFPVQLATFEREGESAPGVLFVANSNFDLLYNAATLQAYDLAVVTELLERCESERKERCAVVPSGSVYLGLEVGDLEVIEAGEGEELLVDEALIGSYTQTMKLSPDARRLYLTVQGVADITHADVAEDGTFDCGNGFAAGGLACTSAYTSTSRSRAAERDVHFPPGPIALYVGALEDLGLAPGSGNYLVVSDRDESISLFVDRAGPGERPTLTDVVPEVASGGAVTLTVEPRSGHVWAPNLSGSRISRVFPAIDAELDDDALEEARLAVLPALSVRELSAGSGGDFRQVVFDPRPGVDSAYMLARTPAALVVADRDGDLVSYPTPSLVAEEEIDLGTGPSRVEIASFDVDGEERVLAFVTSFDSRDLYVVDVDRGELLSVAAGLDGPFSFVVDTARERIYIAEYRTSVIRFVDLAPMLACLEGAATPTSECTPEILGFLGVPNALEGLRQ